MPRDVESIPLSLARAHILAKQHLTPDQRHRNVEAVADDLCGLHATSTLTPYLSLFNRIASFSPNDLAKELYVKKTLLRVRAMRGTLFLVTRRMQPLMVRATAVGENKIARSLSRWGIGAGEYRTLSKKILQSLDGGEKTSVEIKREAPKRLVRTLTFGVGRRMMRRTNLDEVLNLLVLAGRVQSAPERIRWETLDWDGYGSRFFSRVQTVTYSRRDSGSDDVLDAQEAKRMLAKAYVKRYGPVGIDDVAWWMDQPRTVMAKMLEETSDGLARIRISGLPSEFLIYREELESLRKQKVERPLVHFLPYEDPYTKGFKLRRGMIDEPLEKIVYPMGNVLPTVLVDGTIVGTWSVHVAKERLLLLVRRLVSMERTVEERVQKEGRRLGRFFVRGKSVEVFVEGEFRWRRSIAASRPSFYVTGERR